MAILLAMSGGIDARVIAGLFAQVEERIETVRNVAAVRRFLSAHHWSVVVLNAALPDGDGGKVISLLVDAHVDGAIAVLGPAANSAEQAALLAQGVDAYLTLPYDPRDLVARIAALVRRVRRRVGDPGDGIVGTGLLELDVAHLTIQLAGARCVHLTPTEARVLCHLMAHSGRILNHQEIWTHLLGVEAAQVSSNLVGVSMNRVRRKIEPRLEQPRLIVTVRGRGYRFDVPVESGPSLTVAARGGA